MTFNNYAAIDPPFLAAVSVFNLQMPHPPSVALVNMMVSYRVRSFSAGWRALTPHKENTCITSCNYGKAPTRQLHCSTHYCFWSGHTRKQSKTHWRCHPYARKQAQGAEVRLTSGSWKNAVHPSFDSPNTSRRFALGASNVSLVGENPTCSVPAIPA